MSNNQSRPSIVLIGGGTGSFTLLQALKNLPADITALVNMTDDGGSTGVLRDELGVLPPGDVRQCLLALSEAPEELRELFNFRFAKGSLQGHSFGNLFLSAVEKMTDNFTDAVRIAGDVLRIKGRVLPITLQDCKLVMERPDGSKLSGQYNIEITQLESGTRPELRLEPAAPILPDAGQAILEADIVVIAPGILYASLAPALLVDGLAELLKETTARVVYVCNLVNQPKHTSGYAVHDYANEIERFIGAGTLDYVFYNNVPPTPALLKAYALEGELPVEIDEQALAHASYKPIADNFLSKTKHKHNPNSPIKHSLIRHDAETVARKLWELL